MLIWPSSDLTEWLTLTPITTFVGTNDDFLSNSLFLSCWIRCLLFQSVPFSCRYIRLGMKIFPLILKIVQLSLTILVEGFTIFSLAVKFTCGFTSQTTFGLWLSIFPLFSLSSKWNPFFGSRGWAGTARDCSYDKESRMKISSTRVNTVLKTVGSLPIRVFVFLVVQDALCLLFSKRTSSRQSLLSLSLLHFHFKNLPPVEE